MSKRINIFLLVFSLILASFIFISYFTTEHNLTPWMLDKVDKRILVPPEFLSGDSISIGDNIESIRKKMKLHRYWAPTIFGIDSSSSYWSEGNVSTAYFNVDDELNNLTLLIKNQDSIAPKLFFVQTAKTLIKYYGDSCMVYQYLKDTNIRFLRWRLSPKITISMSGSISEKLSVYPQSYYDYFIIRVIYNCRVGDNFDVGDSEKRLENGSLESMGIK